MIGSGFADILNGDSGNNIIQGGTGIDVLTGGAGNDQYYVENTSDRIVEVASGATDRVYTSVTYALQAGSEVEVLLTMGSSTTTNINLTGNEFNNTIGGNAGANLLRGLNGNDTLTGAAGNDTFWGGLGNDTLLGGLNNDTFFLTPP